MSMTRHGSLYLAALAAGLLGSVAAANAGGLSLSVSVPGATVIAGRGGVAVGVGQPGFYGELSVSDVPAPPALIYSQPVLVEATPGYVGPPIYLHVRPGYERHWAEHCAEYHACARRVYFVRDDWYNNVYVPRYHHFDRDHYRDHDVRRDHGPYRGHDDHRRFARDDHDRGDHRGHDDRRADRRDGDRHDHRDH